MSDNNEVAVLPTTKQEMTQADIDASVKISRQVLKTKLEKEREAAQAVAKPFEKKFHEQLNSMEEAFEGPMREGVASHPHLKTLMDAVNPLLDEKGRYSRVEDMLNKIYNPIRDMSHSVEAMEEVLERGGFEVAYSLAFNLPSATTGCVFVRPSPELKQSLEEYLANLKEWNAAKDVCLGISRKLLGIDATLKDVEAQLLINELGSTESGKRTLAATQDIISGMLDGNSAPLQLLPDASENTET